LQQGVKHLCRCYWLASSQLRLGLCLRSNPPIAEESDNFHPLRHQRTTALNGIRPHLQCGATSGPQEATISNFVMFDVFYQDGSRYPASQGAGLERYEADFEARVKATIEAQDQEIAEKSSQPRGPISQS
jgi:hypothetical protein